MGTLSPPSVNDGASWTASKPDQAMVSVHARPNRLLCRTWRSA